MVTETSEKQGKLYEKINQAKPYVTLIDKEQATAILSEAKATFPWYVLCNIGSPMFKEDKKMLEEWFKKNFGESKTEKEKQETP